MSRLPHPRTRHDRETAGLVIAALLALALSVPAIAVAPLPTAAPQAPELA